VNEQETLRAQCMAVTLPGCFQQHNNHSHAHTTFMMFHCQAPQVTSIIQQFCCTVQRSTASQFSAVQVGGDVQGARKHQNNQLLQCAQMAVSTKGLGQSEKTTDSHQFK